MAFRIHGVDTVVVGHFNPWIIQPEWLLRQGVIAEGEEAAITLHAFSSPVGEMLFKVGTVTWKVSPERLIVHCDEYSDTATPVIEVLRLLPHTPMNAAGNNFNYVGQASDWIGERPTLNDVTRESLAQRGRVRADAWRTEIVREDDSVMNVHVIHSEQRVAVNFNFHRLATDCDSAIEATRNYARDFETSREFLEGDLRQEVAR